MESVQQIRPNAVESNGVLAHTQAYSIHILGQQNGDVGGVSFEH